VIGLRNALLAAGQGEVQAIADKLINALRR
jgi:hypothetical protein